MFYITAEEFIFEYFDHLEELQTHLKYWLGKQKIVGTTKNY